MDRETLHQIVSLHRLILGMDAQYLGFFKLANAKIDLILAKLSPNDPTLLPLHNETLRLIAQLETEHERLEAGLAEMKALLESYPDEDAE